MIAKKWGFTRQSLDAFGLESHQRAIAATDAGAFDAEIVPIEMPQSDGTMKLHTHQHELLI